MLCLPPPDARKAVCANSPVSLRQAFAQRLREWRAAQNLPLKAVAEGIGVGVSTVSEWELGTRFPSAENLQNVSAFTRIPPCRFFCFRSSTATRACQGCVFLPKSQEGS